MGRTFATVLLLPLSPLLLAGCGKPFNESIDLVGVRGQSALSEHVDATHLGGGPSIEGFDRRAWPVVTVAVPTGQVAHYPTYAANFRCPKDRGPWDPAHPDAGGALVDETEAAADALDAVVQPVYSALLLVCAPVEMILGRPPWKLERSPAEPYELVPDHEAVDRWSWVTAD